MESLAVRIAGEAAASPAAGPLGPGAAESRRGGSAPGLDLVDPGHHLRVDPLNVAQDALGVGAQRVAHLAQVGHQLESLGAHILRRQPSLTEQVTGVGLGLQTVPGRRLRGVGHRLLGVLVRVGDDRQGLAGGRGPGLLVALASLAEQPLRLGPGVGHQFRGLLLGGLDPVVGRPVALGDPLTDAGLGLDADPLGGGLGGGQDRADAVGGRRGGAILGPGGGFSLLRHTRILNRTGGGDRKTPVVGAGRDGAALAK